MKKITVIILISMMSKAAFGQDNFKKDQLNFKRVEDAYRDKWPALQKELEQSGLAGNVQLYLTAYKSEGKLELWAKGPKQKKFQLFKSYDFCAHSGTLGPKVMEGDKQTPEGFYKINVFNPQSSYHLSLGINYPNQVDLVRSGKGNNPGSDIYIHGDCVTVGCIPLSDDKIKEVYILAVEARAAGQTEIPVYIFPFKMTEENIKRYAGKFPGQVTFWNNLKSGYAVLCKRQNNLMVDEENGQYIFK